jgi:hypothetical protein
MARFDPRLLDDIRDRLPISSVVGSRVTWDRRKTNPGRGDFWACCPIHGERSPSFHCEDQKGRYHCFGCGISGDVFRFLQEVDGVSFPRAVEMAAQLAGVPMPGAREETAAEKAERDRRAAELERKKQRDADRAAREDERKLATAAGIWRSTQPLAGTLAEIYLRSRGIAAAMFVDEPNLRFHPALPYPGDGKHPALVARVQRADGTGCGVWRIYLAPDGRGKADVENAKLGLGNVRGGAVRLGGEGTTIGIAEGVETALAAREMDRRHPIWAGLSTSGMQTFEPPEFVKRVLIYPDGDSPRWRDGEVKGPPGIRAAILLRDRLSGAGMPVSIVEPPVGGDYLDILKAMKALA